MYLYKKDYFNVFLFARIKKKMFLEQYYSAFFMSFPLSTLFF